MSLLLTLIGAVGSLLFGIACVPMAWSTVRSGKASVTDRSTIWTFVFATALVGVYLVGVTGWNVPSITIFVETICWGLVAWYSYYPRQQSFFSSELVASALGWPRIGFCIRPAHTDGPCNGWPRPDCPGHARWKAALDRWEDRVKKSCPHGHKDWDDCPVCCH